MKRIMASEEEDVLHAANKDMSSSKISENHSDEETWHRKNRVQHLETSLSTLEKQLTKDKVDLQQKLQMMEEQLLLKDEELCIKDLSLQRLSVVFSPDMNKFTSVEVCDNALLALKEAESEIVKKRKRLAAEEELCVICMETKRDTVLVPCGHLQFCWGCVERLPNKNCPCCTVVYREKVKVFCN
jgi:hypothetical protein